MGADNLFDMLVVMVTGNLWINFRLSIPISVCTRTHVSWVQVLTDFPLGTGTGTKPQGMGMDSLPT